MRINKSRESQLFWTSLKAILKKEFIHIKRNPAVLTFALVFPILELLLLGYILDINVKDVDTVIYDLANNQESKALIDEFTNTNDFRIVKRANTDEELYKTITSGQAKVGIKIPVNYSKQILEQETSNILVIVDGSNATVTSEAVNVSNRVTLEISIKQILERNNLGDALPIETRTSVMFNPTTRSANYFLPGLIVWELPAVTILLVALSVVGEREKGTLEQLSITPINPVGMVIGKMVPYAILAFLELCEILLVIRFIFQVPINGNVFLLVFMTIPFILASVGLGLVVSSGANTQIEAMQMGLIFRVFPPFYFTGYVFPLESSPYFFQVITQFIPERYLMEIVRGIILRGAGFKHLWTHALILCVMSIITLSAAAAIYKKKFK